MSREMTGEERADFELTEADAREIITKRLEWVYSQRKTDFSELIVFAGHVWIMFILSAIGSIYLHHRVSLLPIIEVCLAITVFSAVLYMVVSVLLTRYRKHLIMTVSALSDQEHDLIIGGFFCTVQPGGGTLFLNLAGLVIWLWACVLHYTLLKPIGQRCEAISVEVYRDFVLDWYRSHPLEDAGD